MRLYVEPTVAPNDPDEYLDAVIAEGYRACAFGPKDGPVEEDALAAWAAAANKRGILIAEVGAWGNNPISPDEDARKHSIADLKRQLHRADLMGARCVVNVAGSRGERWAGPHPDNLTRETFDMIVAVTREIIDEVQPKRAKYTLETMPWAFPDSAQSYRDLVEAIDRPGFGVHLDPFNIINCPARAFDTASVVRECFRLLGPHIVACHAKDVKMHDDLTVRIEEVFPGDGCMDYRVYLREIEKLDRDMPVRIEHIPRERFPEAIEWVRRIAAEIGVTT